LNSADGQQRLQGYKQALAEAQLPFDERLVVEGNFTEQSGLLGVKMLFSRSVYFSAIFTADDQTALGARLGLYRMGLRVPEDISLIGFDDQPGTAFAIPPLTTIRQPVMEMGKTAAAAALKLIENEEVVLTEFSTELVVRESVARLTPNSFRRNVNDFIF
jgi:LacI family transcriptional regulator